MPDKTTHGKLQKTNHRSGCLHTQPLKSFKKNDTANRTTLHPPHPTLHITPHHTKSHPPQEWTHSPSPRMPREPPRNRTSSFDSSL